MISRDAANDSITYVHPDTGVEIETKVIGGACKLQWKADWAMRWFALGIDYEMSGKDLIESVTQSSKITRALGGTPPVGISYELFLDANGEKISKSKGNGLTIDEWLRYGSPESLSLFMYNQPKRAKRLHFDVIPKTVDEYYQHRTKIIDRDRATQMEDPVWHIHSGIPGRNGALPSPSPCCSIWRRFVWRMNRLLSGDMSVTMPSGVTAETHPELDCLIGYAVNYYQDLVSSDQDLPSADRN